MNPKKRIKGKAGRARPETSRCSQGSPRKRAVLVSILAARRATEALRSGRRDTFLVSALALRIQLAPAELGA